MNVPSASRALALVACLALLAPGTAAAAKKPAPKPKPDLSIVTTTGVAGTTSAGASVTVSNAVHAGKKLPVKASKTLFFLSTDAVRDKKDKQLGIASTPAMKAGKKSQASTKVTLPSTLTGSFYVIACADGANKIAESSEKNNCRPSSKRTVEVPAPPKAALPSLTFSGHRDAVEGNSGTANALEYDIVLSAASADSVSFKWAASASGVSASPSDFVASSGTVTLAPGQTTATVKVPVVGDASTEPDEKVRVKISGAQGAKIDTRADEHDAVILDDENGTVDVNAAASTQTALVLSFSAAPTNLAANGSQFTIPGVTVTGASQVGATVTVTTTPQIAKAAYVLSLNPPKFR